MTKRKPLQVYVVMGNEFPHSAWASEDAAHRFCIERNNEEMVRQDTSPDALARPRVYYRWYQVQLHKTR